MIVKKFDSDEALAATLADIIAADLNSALTNNAQTTLILPGGQSPVKLMEHLAEANLLWEKITVCPSDERCVAPDHTASNAGQIARVLGHGRLFRLWQDGWQRTPATLSDLNRKLAGLPPIGTTVIGMGTDGHFASIFPGMAWDETFSGALWANAPHPPVERVSLGPKLLLQTGRLVLLACGQAKARLCEEMADGLHADLPVAKLIKLAGDRLEIYMHP